MKNKKKVSLFRIFLLDLTVLLLIGVTLFVLETRITEEAQKKNLVQRLESITATFSKSYEETREVTDLYNMSLKAKVESLAYLIDHEEDVDILGLKKIWQVDGIYIDEIPKREKDYTYFQTYSASGRSVTIKQNVSVLNEILDNIYTENRILQRLVNLEDLFFIVTSRSGQIVYYPQEEYIGQNISVLGVALDDLVEKDAKWMRVAKRNYYTSTVTNEELEIKITCGVASAAMTTNSHMAVGVLFMVICIIFTIIFLYTYFAKQEEKRAGRSGMIWHTVAGRKMIVFSLLGLMSIGAVTYYIQTLFSLSMYSIAKDNEIAEIKANVEEGKHSIEELTKLYNDSHLVKAQIISRILSTHPELQTKEELRKLSKIFDLEYIMLFDENGVETLSDSGIKGFVISDDPESQSYAFNVLKHGIPYVVQEAMPDDLTGDYHQFIGVLMTDEEGESNGFLQIAISTLKLDTLLEEASLKTILSNSIAGTGDEIIAVDSKTGVITFASMGDFEEVKAVDLGLQEDQLKNRFFGYINVDGVRYYANSVDIDGQYVYVAENSESLFSGRSRMTVVTQLLCMFNMMLYLIYMYFHDVEDLREITEDLYVEVTNAEGQVKTTQNIVTRMMKRRIEWNNKTPEEKTSVIVRYIVSFFAVIFLIILPFRNVIYTEDTIFGFIVSNKWEKGFNVFALTESLIIIFEYLFIVNVFDWTSNEVIRLVNPKSETMVRLLRSFMHYICAIAMIYLCLSFFGFDSRSLLASVGLLTLIVGLGARDLITDILSGIFIIFEHEFQVGDIIEINGYKGRVLEIGIRTTKIMNSYQDVKSVNNRNLSNVVNKTRRNSNVDVLLTLPFNCNLEEIEEILNKELPKIKDKVDYIISGPAYGGVDEIKGSSMVLCVRTECLEAYKFEVRTLVNREIKALFDKHGIRIG